MHDDTPGFERNFVSRTIAFYNNELFVLGADGKLTKVDAPNSAEKGVRREWLTLELREPWTVGGKTYTAGSLLVTKFDDFMAGKRDFDVLFAPTDTTSLAGMSWTKSHVVLNVLDDVKSRLQVMTHGDAHGCASDAGAGCAGASKGGWVASEFTGAPTFGTI